MFFKPKWKHKDWRIRKQVIDQLDSDADEAILVELAKSDEDWHVRQSALEKVRDQSVIEYVARKDPDTDVRICAVNRLSTLNLSDIEKIAETDPDVDVRICAVTRIISALNVYSLNSVFSSLTRLARLELDERIKNIINGKLAEIPSFSLLGDHALDSIIRPTNSYEIVLASLSPHYFFSSAYSPDFLHIAYVTDEIIDNGSLVSSSKVLYVDGQWKESLGWMIDSLVFSPDSQHIAYAAKYGGSESGHWVAVIDWEKYCKYDAVTGIAFSPDSKSVAYAAKDGNYWLVVNNGLEGKRYNRITDHPIIFNPLGSSVAYIASTEEKSFVVSGNQEYIEHDGVATVTFSPDGERLAYTAFDDNQWCVIDTLSTGAKYNAIGASGIHFSNDSSHLIYAAQKNIDWHVVGNNQESPPYQAIGDIVISLDSAAYAWTAMKENRWFCVVNNTEGEKFNNIRSAQFSPGNHSLSYIAETDNEAILFINMNKNGSYQDIKELTFSKDGTSFAYAAKSLGDNNSRWQVLFNGASIGEYLEVSDLTISPDGQHVAYRAENSNTWSGYIDGNKSSNYEQILTPPVFLDCTCVSFLAVKRLNGNKQLCRVFHLL